MASGEMGALLGSDLDIGVQLRWAVHLAEARSLDLQVYVRVDSAEDVVSDVSLDGGADGPIGVVVGQLEELAESMPSVRLGPRSEATDQSGDGAVAHVVHVTMKKIQSAGPESLRKLLVSSAAKTKLTLLTMARAEMAAPDPDLERERRLFLRYAPCEVVFCYGLKDETDLAHVMVGVASGPHGTAAMRLGRDLARHGDGSMTAVRVNPSVGPDAEDVGELRINARLRRALGADADGVRHRIVIDDDVDQGLRRAWEEGRHDLLVLGVSRAGLQGSRVWTGAAAKLIKADPRPVLVIVSAPSPIKNRAVGWIEGVVERLVPQIDREERVSLVDRIQSSSNWDFDFFVLMALSTTIASVGLIQDSSAVVIGAMLVAPLMTPLLGLGLALVQGNPVLAKISGRAILLGLVVSLAVAVAVGLVTPAFGEPTRQMLGRGRPGVLDLVVAFAAGLAAAYASARPGLLAALPGVAIAAALVPPIATSGLALALGNLDLAANALLLFIINTFVIVLGATASLWAVGLRNIKRIARWRMILGGSVVAVSIVLVVLLTVRPVAAPLAEGVPADLVDIIERTLGDELGLEEVSVAYDEVGVQIIVRVVGPDAAAPEMVDEVRAAVRDHFAKPVRVRLLTRVE